MKRKFTIRMAYLSVTELPLCMQQLINEYCPSKDIDMTFARVDGLTLDRCEVNGLTLEGAVIGAGSGSDAGTDDKLSMQDCTIKEVKFTGGSFERASFRGSIFSNFDDVNAIFDGADFRKTIIDNMCPGSINGANFSGARIKYFTPPSCVRNAIFVNTVINEMAAENRTFIGCYFKDTTVNLENIEYTVLAFCRGVFEKSSVDASTNTISLIDVSCKGSVFKNARLASGQRSDFTDCIFEGVSMMAADLRGCNLTNVDLREMDFPHAKWKGACIKNTQFHPSWRRVALACGAYE